MLVVFQVYSGERCIELANNTILCKKRNLRKFLDGLLKDY
jgi:hypothetical protein